MTTPYVLCRHLLVPMTDDPGQHLIIPMIINPTNLESLAIRGAVRYFAQKKSKLVSCSMTDNLINFKELLVMDYLLSLGCRVTDNLVKSGAFDSRKSIGSFLRVLAWIILDKNRVIRLRGILVLPAKSFLTERESWFLTLEYLGVILF